MERVDPSGWVDHISLFLAAVGECFLLQGGVPDCIHRIESCCPVFQIVETPVGVCRASNSDCNILVFVVQAVDFQAKGSSVDAARAVTSVEVSV